MKRKTKKNLEEILINNHHISSHKNNEHGIKISEEDILIQELKKPILMKNQIEYYEKNNLKDDILRNIKVNSNQ